MFGIVGPETTVYASNRLGRVERPTCASAPIRHIDEILPGDARSPTSRRPMNNTVLLTGPSGSAGATAWRLSASSGLHAPAPSVRLRFGHAEGQH